MLLTASACDRQPSSGVGPASSERTQSPPTGEETSLRKEGLIYRNYDGSAYTIATSSLDGSNKQTLTGDAFAEPYFIRFVESRDRRWAAWYAGGKILVAETRHLSYPIGIPIASAVLLAVSDDGGTVAYTVRLGSDPANMSDELYTLHVENRTSRLMHTFDGPDIKCIGDGVFNATASDMLLVGCGSGMAAGLVLLRLSDGSIQSEDDQFLAWPGEWSFSPDLQTAWLISSQSNESDIETYGVSNRSRQVLYRSDSDGSSGSNLVGRLPLSPDAKSLAFTLYTPDRAPELYVIPTNGGQAAKLFKSSSISRLEGWSPDGTALVVSVDTTTPNQRLRFVNTSTKDVTPVDTGSRFDELLGWTVD